MNQTRANRSANRGYRTDASRPEMRHRRYSAADQAKALGSTMADDADDGASDSDEDRAKKKLVPDFNDLPAEQRVGALTQDRDRMRWKGGIR